MLLLCILNVVRAPGLVPSPAAPVHSQPWPPQTGCSASSPCSWQQWALLTGGWGQLLAGTPADRGCCQSNFCPWQDSARRRQPPLSTPTVSLPLLEAVGMGRQLHGEGARGNWLLSQLPPAPSPVPPSSCVLPLRGSGG